jgi:hypothetical protein
MRLTKDSMVDSIDDATGAPPNGAQRHCQRAHQQRHPQQANPYRAIGERPGHQRGNSADTVDTVTSSPT